MSPATRHQPPAAPPLSLTDRELFDRLGWFTQVRWAFGLFVLLVLVIAWHGLGVRFRVGSDPVSAWPAVHVVLMLFLYNAAFTFGVHIVRRKGRPTRRVIKAIALGQLTCDLVAVFALIHRTGGVENLFLVLMLLPVLIVSELLPRGWAYLGAGVAAALLHLLAWGEQQGWLPHTHIQLAGRGLYGGGLWRDPYFVLHVTIAMTVAIFAMVLIMTTIASRLRKRESQLEEAYRQLHKADEAKGFFMRRAEHEMRAPLAAIHSILQTIALKLAGPSGEAIRLIERAKLRTKDLIDLVRDLRRYSQLQDDATGPPMEPVPLDELVAQTVELFARQAEVQRIALTCRCEPARVHGNPEMLREVATNLITNALQYTPPEGSVAVDLTARDGLVTLAVSDTGIGLSPAAQASLFKEFFRAKEAKEFFAEGTGLGLAIVRRIVRLHGGEITAANRPERGAVFTVHLPPSPPPAPDGKTGP